jgi:xanthine dehydrogenase iron-sulfur cluster and FAD-binding subunit A
MRASTNYRLKAAQNLLRRFQLENASRERPETRVLELS